MAAQSPASTFRFRARRRQDLVLLFRSACVQKGFGAYFNCVAQNIDKFFFPCKSLENYIRSRWNYRFSGFRDRKSVRTSDERDDNVLRNFCDLSVTVVVPKRK